MTFSEFLRINVGHANIYYTLNHWTGLLARSTRKTHGWAGAAPYALRVRVFHFAGLRRHPMAHRFTVICEKSRKWLPLLLSTLPGGHAQSEAIEEGLVNIAI
jgi:hypothetical protein